MTTDISKIRSSLQDCEEVSLPYKVPYKCWIKYITIKGEDEAFYEGGEFLGMGDHKVFLNNKGQRLSAPTCVRSDCGEVLYKSRFFIDTKKPSECEQKKDELDKVVTAQQKVIQKMSQQLKILEDKNHDIQIENYDLHGELKEKDTEIKDLLIKERKYKLIVDHYVGN